MAKAIGMVEFLSIARGIYVADQMVKATEVEITTASSTCPGKYIAIISGDIAAVAESVQLGEQLAGEFLVDSIVIPNVHPEVFPAIVGATVIDQIQALGILESFAISTMLVVADAVLKSADLQPLELRLGNALGGKAYFTFTGDVAAVQTGVDTGKTITEQKGLLVNAEIIPSLSDRLKPSLY